MLNSVFQTAFCAIAIGFDGPSKRRRDWTAPADEATGDDAKKRKGSSLRA